MAKNSKKQSVKGTRRYAEHTDEKYAELLRRQGEFSSRKYKRGTCKCNIQGHKHWRRLELRKCITAFWTRMDKKYRGDKGPRRFRYIRKAFLKETGYKIKKVAFRVESLRVKKNFRLARIAISYFKMRRL